MTAKKQKPNKPQAEGEEAQNRKPATKEQHRIPGLGSVGSVAPPPVERGECEYCNGNGWFYSTPDLGPCVCTSPPPPLSSDVGELVVTVNDIAEAIKIGNGMNLGLDDAKDLRDAAAKLQAQAEQCEEWFQAYVDSNEARIDCEAQIAALTERLEAYARVVRLFDSIDWERFTEHDESLLETVKKEAAALSDTKE